MPERHSPDTMCQGPNRRIEGSVVDGIEVMDGDGIIHRSRRNEPWQDLRVCLQFGDV